MSPEKTNDLAGLKDQVTSANNDLQTIITNMNTAYQTAKQNGGDIFTAQYPDIKAWIAGPGSAYTRQIPTQTATVQTLSDQYADFLAMFSTDPKIKEDMQSIKTPTVAIGGPAPAGWTKVPNTDGSLSWRPVFNLGTEGQAWRGKLTQGSAGGFEITLDASKADNQIEKSWAAASASYDAVFWSVSGSGGWERNTQLQSDASVTATVKVQSSTLVPITPGVWYDGGLMRDLARGTSSGTVLDQGWTAKGGPGSHSIFGEYGLLSTRVSNLVVVYKPSYSITMASSTFSSFHQKIEAGGGVRIGPFTFGGSGGNERTETHSTGNKTTLTSTSTSDNPLIIGVTVAFPGE